MVNKAWDTPAPALEMESRSINLHTCAEEFGEAVLPIIAN
jgi:hypothetical protein